MSRVRNREIGVVCDAFSLAAELNAQALVEYLVSASEKLNPDRYGFVPASRLRNAGWKFFGTELIGEPKQR